ncbi:hypothetical protein G7085_00025 [Tessaracoccus sp. HDW20]|uniref:hypothetical protein n=1 Tax=Tessaracoccus coleopterorum TaxID=2714950 RepID=UPI0018D2B3B9|nr:hypothetical protein [Tessaracoccus coleopterorum]NHB83625.1 hypothetical protein [Tessaracoccus coleopterorum]
MASESCPICGEEADVDEHDPHGHFDTGYEQQRDAEEYFRTLCHFVVGVDDDEEPIAACGDFDSGGGDLKPSAT